MALNSGVRCDRSPGHVRFDSCALLFCLPTDLKANATGGVWLGFPGCESVLGFPRLLQVFERGLKAIPLSVDLWLHYINFHTTEFSNEEDAEAKLRK